MTRPTEVQIDVAGLRLAAKAWGPDEGMPWLGLHGWLDNAGTFDLIAPELPGLRLVAVDLPGHGRSQHRPDPSGYAFVEAVEIVIGLADALGWERFGILGHSMGACIAALTAGAFSDRVAATVWIDALGPLTQPADDAPAALAAAMASRQHARQREARVYPTREAIVARVAKANPTHTPQAIAALVARGIHRADGGWVFAHDPALKSKSLQRLTEEQVHAYLRAIRCPGLLVWAEDGWPFPADAIAAREACLSTVAIERLPGTHHLHLTDPRPVAARVQAFIDSLPPT